MFNLIKILSQSQIDTNDIKNNIDIPTQTAPVDSSVATALQIIMGVFGAIAVIVIIIAGIQFMLSQGDPAKTNTARNTIIYAAVGLAICALAFTIVSFVSGRF